MKIYLQKRVGVISKENAEKGRPRKISLYLMYYYGSNKKREYEFLDLFLYYKPNSALQKQHNKETLLLAESIKAQKLLDYQSTSHGFISKVRGQISFLKFFDAEVQKRSSSYGNYGNWQSALKHLTAYCNGYDIPLEKVDDAFLEGFRQYLLGKNKSVKRNGGQLSQNSALSYFNKVRAALKEAYNCKMIKDNPVSRVKCIKEEETHREYLTFDELQCLVKTECEYPIMKTAFIFSALTGLRFSDVQALTWGKIKYDEINGYSIIYIQKKQRELRIYLYQSKLLIYSEIGSGR